jgi:outer membrane protein OmpA-like peptidoglycan-associated protein
MSTEVRPPNDMKRDETMKKCALTLMAMALAGSTALADGIKLPGITIDENGIQAPGVVIDEDGIRAPGVTIDDQGVSAPGVRVDDGGVSAPGVRIETGDRVRIRGERTVGHYDGEIFGEDGVIRRDNFNGMDLRGYDFSGYTLERVNFANTDLEGADFSGAVLERVNFSNSNLEGADFSDTLIRRVNFDSSILAGACFIHTTMERTGFSRSDLTDAIWIGVQAERTNFSDSDRGRLVTRGPANCFDHHSAIGATVLQASLFERPEVTSATAIEEALSEGADARVDLTVNFAYDSDQVEGAARAQIMEIANALQAQSLAEQRILVEGHTDGDGDSDYNVDLSYRRAIAVVRTLVEQYDVPSDRLEVKGFGEDRPIADNGSDQGRALNRRVTLVNLGRG